MTSGGNNFSRTYQDLKLQFPGLSRTKVIFQDFPGPGILKKKIRTSQEAWEPWQQKDQKVWEEPTAVVHKHSSVANQHNLD